MSASGDAPPKTVAASVSVALTDPATGASVANISVGKPAKVSATVRDTTGAVVANTVVTFATTATLATMTPQSGTAITDTSGVATIQVDAANVSAAGATTISATATVAGNPVSGSAGFGVISTSTGVTGISVALTSPTSGTPVANISTGSPAKVTATVRDTSGALVPNAVVTFATTPALATLLPASGTALTDASGVASVQLLAANPSAAGATTVSATASVGGASLSASAGFAVIATTAGATGMSVSLANPNTGAPIANISAVTPARVVATLRDAAGALVPNAVVTFATSAALATMVPSGGSALTDASGVASIQIVGAGPAAAGAGSITATATIGGSLISGAVNFSVIPTNAGVASVNVALSDPVSGAARTTISSGKPASVTAILKDAGGMAVPNTVVTFATTATLASMTPSSGTALTDAAGVAALQLDAASPAAAGSTTVTATATIAGAQVSGGASFSVSSLGVASVSLALTDPATGLARTSISSGKPAKVTATVRDAAGLAVPNTVVTFATTATLATMTPGAGTALTDAAGAASVLIDPSSPLAAGATTITATATVGGAAASSGASFSVVAANAGVASVSLALTDPATGVARTTISAGKPARVTATVKDASGSAVPNVVVTFATSVDYAAMTPASGTALTDAAGMASILVDPSSPSAAGATTITAAATISGAPVSSGTNFSVVAANISVASVNLTLTDPATGVARTNISAGKPARVTASVKDATGLAVANTVVTFATSAALATMTPATGTALTDAAGMASIQIDPPSPLAAGATTITATATVAGASVVGSAAYSVTATSVGVPGVSVALTDPTSGNAVSSISPGSPAKVKATIRNSAGSGVANAVVTFSTTATLATMTPSTGTALTDGSGVATIQIDAASLTAAGATTISATATVDGAAVTGSAGFSVSAANAGLANMTVGSNPLSSYATTSVSVTVTGVPATTPVTINFSSICAGSGKASLPASVQSANGVATATYTDKGCASTDTITASVAGLAVTKTVTLKVNSPGAASLQFVSATPGTIVLKGTGGAGLLESSLVKFKVVDNNNVPVSSGVNVTFDLTTRTGGILLDGASSAVTKLTDANGEATVSVQSGTTPTAVWVNASLTGTSVFSQSNQLRISTGRPAQDRFSLSVTPHNIEGYSTNGVTTSVSVIASDRLGNPVPDGTAINFISEGAQIAPSCATVNGTCSVTFTSANPRPSGDGEPAGIVTKGRVTVAAYSVGEESFSDANGNNKYDSGELYNDLGMVYIDSNESGVWDAGEQSILFNSSNNSACSSGISTSPAAPSKAGSCDVAWGSAHVRQSEVIVLSGSTGYVKKTRPTVSFVPGVDDPGTTYSMGGANVCNKVFTFFAFDQNKNPLASGTELATFSTTSALSSITFVPDKVQDSNSAGGTLHQLLITKPQSDGVCVSLGTAGVPISIRFRTPSQILSIADFTITD